MPSQAEDARGTRRQQLDDAPQRQLEVMMQHGDGDGQRGFESDDAHGGALELDLLLVKGVGRVVGGDGVDGAVGDAARSWRRDRRAERSGGFIL